MRQKTALRITKKILGILMLGLFVLSIPMSHAQEGGEETVDNGSLFKPVEKQIIQLSDESMRDDWSISKLETYGLKFLVRGKEALTWSLSIEDGGFHNEAIEKSYSKVLTIVNSLLVLGLLAIAIMWIFSILIPRKYLKKVILLYGLTVIFINFALPINQLFIDGTNLLQRILLTEKSGNIQITDIVQTPAYSQILSYRNESETQILSENNSFTIKLSGADEETTSIGKIRAAQGEEISEEVISLNNKEISLMRTSSFNINQEQIFFRFFILILTGIAYFIIALIFILRIIILWALLILSPVLLLLAIFRSTRGWFLNWLSLYGRWLFIGPLTALGIAIVVNIWQLSGLPITVSENYVPEVFSSEKLSSIVFYLPGKSTANTLSNTEEMMEYIIFLIMLYLPIFLGFTLTRRKVLHESLVAVSKNLIRNSQVSQQQLIQQALAIQEKDEEKRERPMGIVDSFKSLVTNKIGLFAEAAMPVHRLKVKPETPQTLMPTASNFLPENLAKTPIPKMLELLGMQKDSKSSHKRIIEKLASIESISDKKEKEKVQAVMQEIETRAEDKQNEALAILHEVQTVKELSTGHQKAPETEALKQNSVTERGNSININVNDSKPEADRKVRDSSLDSKSEEKTKNKKEKTAIEGDEKKNESDSIKDEAPKQTANNNPEENAN